MKVKVELKYLDFLFSDVEEAVEFAKMANKTYVRDEDEAGKDVVTVTVTGFDMEIEAIEVMEDFTEGMSTKEAVLTSNILKYMLRWKKKNGVEDLMKAQWYLNRLIDWENGDGKKEEL